MIRPVARGLATRVGLSPARQLRLKNGLLQPVPLLLAWCGFLFFYGLGAGTLYRTEALRAIIGAEALHGHWLVPTLYGEPFLTKPPGQYIAIGLASLPFGQVTEVSARLPSAMAATVAVLCFYGILHRAVSRWGAFAGALLLPVAPLWLDKAPSAEIDMLQLAWVTVALGCFLKALASEETGTRARWLWSPLALAAVTGGFLTKWTAPAFFYLTVVAVLLTRKRLGWLWSLPHLAGVVLAATVVAGWACAVASETGWARLIDTVLREAGQRFAPQSARDNRWLETLAYPFAVLAANLPWSALALVTLRPSFHRLWNDEGRRLLLFFHCWTWPNLLFWTGAAQHNVRYSLPMAPGLAGLGIMVCIAWADGKWHGCLARIRPASAFAAIVVLWAVIKIAFVEAVIPSRGAPRQARPIAAALREHVPPGAMLYLCKLKDEGIMFYYGGPVRKLATADPARVRWAVLIEAEWHERAGLGAVEAVCWLRDQQEAPIVLVRIHPSGPVPER